MEALASARLTALPPERAVTLAILDIGRAVYNRVARGMLGAR